MPSSGEDAASHAGALVASATGSQEIPGTANTLVSAAGDGVAGERPHEQKTVRRADWDHGIFRRQRQ